MGRDPNGWPSEKFAPSFQTAGDDPKQREEKNDQYAEQSDPSQRVEQETLGQIKNPPVSA